jgi:PAS domain S-box-containing protein
MSTIRKKEGDYKEQDSITQMLGGIKSKHIEISAQTVEKFYHLMVEEVTDYAILLLDVDGNILNWNRGAELIKGFTAAEVAGQNFAIFYTADDRKNRLPEKLLGEAMQNGRALHEGWRLKKDGGKFWGSVVITALHDEDGNIIGFSKLTRDLTQRKATEEKAQRYAMDLEFKNEELRRSEERYHRMIAEIEDYAIILLDLDGNILNWNKGAQNIKGYTSEEILGRNFSIFYLQDDIVDGLPKKLINIARDKGKAIHEGWRVKKDGTIFWGSITITALHDNDNNIVGYSKVTRDLTERKKAEERLQRYAVELEMQNAKLQRSEESYHRMIAEVEDYAIILLDTDGNILNWNKGAQKIKGYQEHEILGKNFRNFYLPEDRDQKLPERLLSDAVKNNKATHEGWRLRKDGTRFWGSIVITALHDSAGQVTGFSKVTRDLTKNKEAEDFILMQNRYLEEFAYVASHDLQEPLRKIILFSSMLGENINDEKAVRNYLSKITGASERMGKLIRAVLDYSRSGSSQIKKEVVDLNTIISDIKVDFELLLQERNAEIITERLPSVKGVPIQLHQLFANLISNAIKFCEDTPKIEISSQTAMINESRFVKILVSDNGVGFNPDHAEKIFHMFYRLNEKNAGTGIGLALCRRIVESHGGKISATGKPGIGSVFEILLPVV